MTTSQRGSPTERPGQAVLGRATLGASGAMHTVAAPQLPGEVRFRREGDLLCVDHATPVMWFARHALVRSRGNPDVGLSFDGTHVTLHASNGRWIWKLTGRIWCRDYVCGAGSLVMVEGIWPD
jgi:hypothetical protein